MPPLKFLFIPVSSTEGIGEYTRSLIIAKQILAEWPHAEITFILNQAVTYLANCPFKVIASKGSATKDKKTVKDALESIRPNLVLFDASGRASQFRRAKKLGAKVCFISQHKKKRRRGLKLNRLTSIDAHWVAQTAYSIAPLGRIQRSKLKLFSRNHPVNIGPVFAPIHNQNIHELRAKYQIPEHFFVFNAGSGGHKHLGQLTIEILSAAAKLFSEKTGIASVVVYGANYPLNISEKQSASGLVTFIDYLPNNEFICLLMNAKGRVISAGDTLLQCIELSLPSVAIAVAKDQPFRLSACVDKKLVMPAELDEINIVNQAETLLDQETVHSLRMSMEKHQSGNALIRIIKDVRQLLALS